MLDSSLYAYRVLGMGFKYTHMEMEYILRKLFLILVMLVNKVCVGLGVTVEVPGVTVEVPGVIVEAPGVTVEVPGVIVEAPGVTVEVSGAAVTVEIK
jgi:hypothetical protein